MSPDQLNSATSVPNSLSRDLGVSEAVWFERRVGMGKNGGGRHKRQGPAYNGSLPTSSHSSHSPWLPQ